MIDCRRRNGLGWGSGLCIVRWGVAVFLLSALSACTPDDKRDQVKTPQPQPEPKVTPPPRSLPPKDTAPKPAPRGDRGASPMFGFTLFPYDLTPEASRRVTQLALPHSNLIAVHFDRCLPWAEALEDQPYPKWLRDDWREIRANMSSSHTVYIAVTPTHSDRRTLAPQCGASEDQPGELPRAIRGKPYDDPAVKRAYVNYVRKAIDEFQPKYINIGIEISEMTLQYPDLWPQFEALYLHTLRALKASHPKVQVGLEMVLQSLMHERVARAAKPAIEQSDYLGISFYPYGYAYGEAIGAQALPKLSMSGPNKFEQWRTPLRWLRQYTRKPIAICETGYTTKDVHLRQAGLRMPGNREQQRQFVRDLIDFAYRDQYLFVVWFILVDYERLLAKFPDPPEVMKIWVNTGLFDGDVRPKPGWEEWKRWRSWSPDRAPD